MKVSINSDSFIRVFQYDKEISDLLETIPSDENVDYQEWKRVEVTEGGKANSRTRLVSRKVNKNEFVKIMKADVSSFREHADRIKKQYRNLKVLKDTLPANNAIMQMDFAENYRCQCNEEVQSAYFDGPQVTLHPVVVYAWNEAGEVKPSSYIIVSDELSHSASTVDTFVRKMIPIVKEKVQNLIFLHYWTDSPTSQYRNRYIFDILRRHEAEFKIKARWNYFESGHGKGPCDGIGETSKRLVDDAIKQQKVVMQDANDFFFKWAVPYQSQSAIKYIFVESKK